MTNRSQDLLSIRLEIKSAKIHDLTSDDEKFQNQTLRPIIKFQNELLIAVFKNYIRKHKNTFYELGASGKLEFIEKSIQKDIKFRNSMKGMIIGQFTIEEYETYIMNSSSLNKRMMNMVVERLKDHVQAFQNDALPV